jgi:hypothetical protein
VVREGDAFVFVPDDVYHAACWRIVKSEQAIRESRERKREARRVLDGTQPEYASGVICCVACGRASRPLTTSCSAPTARRTGLAYLPRPPNGPSPRGLRPPIAPVWAAASAAWGLRLPVAGRVVVEPEQFQRGELVTLRVFESAAMPLGRVVDVTPDGDRAEVAWFRRPGHEHQVTREPTGMLRRVHESEIDPDDA